MFASLVDPDDWYPSPNALDRFLLGYANTPHIHSDLESMVFLIWLFPPYTNCLVFLFKFSKLIRLQQKADNNTWDSNQLVS